MITKSYTVWCSTEHDWPTGHDCHLTLPHNSKLKFIKEVKQSGWKIKNKQWVCPVCGDDIRKGDIGYSKETQIYYKVLAVEEHIILISWEFHGIEDNEWISREDYQKLEKIKR